MNQHLVWLREPLASLSEDNRQPTTRRRRRRRRRNDESIFVSVSPLGCWCTIHISRVLTRHIHPPGPAPVEPRFQIQKTNLKKTGGECTINTTCYAYNK
jgi:hypothetical protein